MKAAIKYMAGLLALGLICACGASAVNKANIDPASLTKQYSTNSAYLFGSYAYELRSQNQYGDESGYLSLLVEPVGDSMEKPFFIRMVKDSGTFLFPLAQGNYELKGLILHVMNQNLIVSGIHNFCFEVKNGEVSCLGKISLVLYNDSVGNVTISASSGRDDQASDISEFKSYVLTGITNTISVPKSIYFTGVSM
jgi:hypothetical protein